MLFCIVFMGYPMGSLTPRSETIVFYISIDTGGARWLSGRVSDSGARGPGFETYRRRVVSLITQEAMAPSRYD